MNQNLSHFFSNNAQGSGGESGNSLSGFLDTSSKAPPARTNGRVLDASAIIAQEGADHLKPVIEAIYKQESGSGANARTSIDGAQGGMQIIPATFQRYARPGERIDNPDDNMRVGVRIIKDLAGKFGNDPARIATGYFSGEGNVNSGQGDAWKNDRADGNGKRVSGYVADIVSRVGSNSVLNAQPAASAALPDLDKAPKWADVVSKPEYASLTPQEQAEAKAAYFDHWIAPHAGDQVASMRQQFLAMKPEEPGFMTKMGDVLGRAADNVPGLTPHLGKGLIAGVAIPAVMDSLRDKSVMEGVAPTAQTNPEASFAPVRPETRKAIDAAWDAATPEKRLAMQQQKGWIGQLARDRAALFAAQDKVTPPGSEAVRQFDPRIEARRARLVGNGEDPRFAETAAMHGAASGVMPGQEVAALGGTVQKSDFDFNAVSGQDSKNPFRNTAQNLTAGVLKIGPTALKGVADIASMATGDTVGSGISKSMQSGMDTIDATVATRRFNQQKKEFNSVMQDDTKGIGDMFAYLLDNPAVLVDNLVTTIGSMYLPAGMAKGAIAGTTALGMSKAAVSKAAMATTIGTTAAQNAADTFEAMKDRPLADRYRGAAVSAAVTMLVGKATEGGFEGMIAKRLAGELQAGRISLDVVKQFFKAAGKEGIQEFGEEWGNVFGEAAAGGQLNFTDAAKRTVFAGALGGIMGGGGHFVLNSNGHAAPQHTAAIQAENARQSALAAWADGLGGRRRPPRQQHLSEQAADAVVRDLAASAGIPSEFVLPTAPQSPIADTESVHDNDVLAFAEGRYQQLRTKRDGQIETTVGEMGIVDQDVPGGGLSPQEQQELAVLEQARGDVPALRTLYGLDQSIPSDQLPLASQSSEATPAIGPIAQTEAGQQFQITMEPGLLAAQENQSENGHGAQLGAAQHQPTVSDPAVEQWASAIHEPAADPAASAQATVGNAVVDASQQDGAVLAQPPVAESEADREARLEREAIQAEREPLPEQSNQYTGIPLPWDDALTGSSINPFDDPAQNKPRTEKEAKQRKALERIARGTAYFSKRNKAEQFIADNGLADTHEVKQHASGANRWDVVAKQSNTQQTGLQDQGQQALASAEAGQRYNFGTGEIGDQAARDTQGDVRSLQTANTDPFAGNKIFTADKIEAARARLKSKLGTLNSGIDPELLVDGMTIAGGYIESGVRKYSDYAKAMVEDFGEKIRPYLRSFYEAARNYPGLDTAGMTTAAELDLMEKQGTAEHTKATAGMEAAIGETVKAPKRTKERKQSGASMLRDDYGVSHIDGYDGSGETSSGPVKTQFLNDTRNYLKDVSKALEARGFVPATARNGKPVKPVSVNESGVAGSGDVTLAMFHPELDRGIYIHIGDTALRGVVPSTKSGIAVMMRATKAGDPWGGDQNRWMPVDMTSAELADSAADAVEKNSAKKQELTLEKPAAVAQNELNAKETANASLVQTEPVSARTAAADQQDVTDSNRDSEPLGTGLAADGQGLDSDQGVSGSPQESGTGRSESEAGTGPEPSVELGKSTGIRSESGTTSTDDHVIDADEIGKGGLGQKYRDNVAAIKILKTLEAEGRTATPEERKALAKYVGWGAMKGPFDPDNKAWAKQHSELKELLTAEEFRAARASTLDAHYTSPVAVGAMYDALARLGVKSGRVLEPSVGVGNFFGLMPREMRNASQLHGVELDSLTSRLVTALYPKAKIAKATGFQDFEIPSEYFDVVIGNPPFGSHPLVDKERSPYSGFSIHNYFLAKSIDKLRPGGVMAIVVSHNFLDAQDGRVRKWIGERASLIGGVRLPNTAFKENAGTEVVTDILIFQKHDKNGLPSSIAPWQDVVEQININPKTGEHAAHKVSQFFVSNPQFVLGKPSAGGTMYSANEYTVEQDGNIKEALAKWVKTLPENTFDNIDRARDSAVVDMAVPDGVKVGSFYVDTTGKVMRRGDDLMGEKTAQAWKPRYESQVGRMKGMIAIRDTLRQQMRLERSVDATEQEIEANRAELNRLYDDFLKKYKHLNSTTNRSIFLDDTEAHLIQGLEFDYDKGVGKATAEKEGIEQREASATKADIFQRRVAFPPQDYMTVSTAKDALLASLNYRGRVDGAYMAEVYGKPMDEIVKELGDVVFDDPQSGIVTADEYLSGDVKTKLAEAKAAAQDNAKYRRNVEALEKVIPKDKTPSEISVSIGAAFVPAEIYEQFVKHISGGSATASYVKATGQWLMAFNTGSDPALNTGRFGTSDLSAQDLFQLTMFGRGAVVKKTLRNADGSTTTILLEKETEAAREKQNAIKAEWQKWLWQDPERADRIASLYNDKMNRIVVRTFDGSHMRFPGMNPAISLLAHQKNGVWRGLQSFQVLYDHVVGAGKTFEMATLAMEMRRLGIARKPVFVVPNHLTLQWRSEFTRLYPGSNILAATPEDFSKDNRERLFAKIITGDWDAVVIGHSSLKKIGLPEKTEVAVLQEQIDELADAIEDMKRARGDKRITADMERIRKNLDAKMKDKLAAVGKRSKMVTFDELGIDAMFIDEMHEFKNLTYNTTMDRNPGMGNPAGSAKAFDLFVKVRWLFDTFGDKTPFITATGTPVSNSLVEMFNMQRYMQYPTLKREGLHVFDAWAKQFGSVENVYEVAPSGSGYRQSTRFAKFTNLPGLMSLYNSFADTITLDDLKAQEEAQGKRFPVPKMVSGRPVLVVAARSPSVAALMGVPKAQTDAAGNIQFGADLSAEIKIEQDDKSGKWMTRVGDAYLGQFETVEDARLKVVERALTPVVSVDPQSILGRFANLRQLTKETKGKVNALSLTGEANKAGLDYRLVNPAAPDFAGSKINLAVDNMLRTYKQWQADRGTQLVFCDLSIPLSARASYSSKARRLYVRDDAGGVEMKRGTLHALPGHEDLPYFVIQRGEKDAKRFDVYDAASGLRLQSDLRSKQDAIESASGVLGDEAKRQKWINAREAAREIEQGEIDEYNNEHDIEVEDLSMFFTREDIAGMSGSAKFSVYDDIKAKLIAKGVPEREIAFIHDYSTPAAKDKLFRAVNAGEVRFLLGSTPKMGAGTNVQKRLVGLHHIDAPWRPSDLEQREGRIIRRGNELYARDPDNFEVFIGRYATEQTYDTRRWQILEHKARGIEQLRNYDGTINEIDDIEGEAANAADMKAAASGDPLILEETKLRNDVRRLEQLQAGHADEVLSMTRKARDAQEYADTHGPAAVREIKTLLGTTAKHPADKEGFAPVSVQGGKPLANKESAHKALASVFENVRSHMIDTALVQYRGLTFRLEHFAGNVILRTPTGNGGTWNATDPFSPSGMVQRLKNYIDRLPSIQDETQARIEKSRKDAASMRELAKQPFPQAKDLDAAREAHKQVQRALMAKGPEVPENQKAAVAAGIEQQKAKLREQGFGDALDELLGKGNWQEVVLATSNNAAPLPESEWLSEAQFVQVIQERTVKFRNPPGILVRDTPVGIRGLGRAAPGSVYGATIGGKIYLFRDANATTADIVRTLWHELVHYGLRRFLTKEQYIAQMQKLYERDSWIKGEAESWLSTDGDDVKQAKAQGMAYARARGVDEALAKLAETSEGEYRNNTLIAKAIRQTARWIAAVAERFGFLEFAAKYRAVTKDEARALVRSLFQKLRDDAPATRSDWGFTADPAFKQEGGTHTKQSLSKAITAIRGKAGTAIRSLLDGGLVKIIHADAIPPRILEGNGLHSKENIEDSIETINIEGIESLSNEDEINEAESVFLSSFPKSTRSYRHTSAAGIRAKAASDLAWAGLGHDTGRTRRVASVLGQFTGYKTRQKIVRGLDGKEMLFIQLYGKEQMEAGLDQAPALTMTVAADGEFAIYGPPSNSFTYKQFAKRGWAEPATDQHGNLHETMDGGFWTRLTGATRAQAIDLIGDAHARALEWLGVTHFGMHWKRTTGATGATTGREGAIYFSQAGAVRAYVDPQDGNVYLVADNIPQNWTMQQLEGLLKHEVAVHVMRLGKSDKEFQSILNYAEGMRKAGNKAMQAARDRVPAETQPENVREEMLGYFIEANPVHSVTRRVIAWFKAAVARIAHQFGISSATLEQWMFANDEAKLIQMAHDALLNAPRINENSGGQTAGYDGAYASNNSILYSRGENGQWFSNLAADAHADFVQRATVKRNASTFDEARAAAKGFQGKTLRNEQTGMEAVVSRNSLDKMLSEKAVKKSKNPASHAFVVANLDHLFERAMHGWNKADLHGDPGIANIHRFFAPVIHDGQAMLAKLTVKETARKNQANPLYTVEAVEFNEKSPAAQWVESAFQSDGIDPKSIHSARDVLSLAQQVQEFNSGESAGTNNQTSDTSQPQYSRPETMRDNSLQRLKPIEFNNIARQIQHNLIEFFGNRKETLKTFGKYDRTLSTQYHKALKDEHYGKVFAYVNAMQNEVSLTSIRPAELAPGVLPRVDDVKSALRGIVKGKRADKNLTQAADAVFAGTLAGNNVMAGKVWSDDELRSKFEMNDTGIALYRQARAAIDASLDEVAAAEAYAMAQGIVPKAMRRQIIDNPRVAEGLIVGELEKQIRLLSVAIRNAKRQGNEQQQAEYEAILSQYSGTKSKVEKIFVTAKNLKMAGYAPLMRFGKWTVTVQSIDPASGNVLRDDEGKPLTEYFSKFETEGEAISVRNQMEARYKNRDDIRVKAGVDSQAAHELYAGISPETIALFGEAVGANEVTQKYYQMALSERSTLKRRLERKGTAGYSEDMPRVLSNFITSNGRFAAQRYYLRDLNNAIKYIPQEKGDVKDEAMRLKQFVLNPNDPAAPVSSVMFAWFLGGSVAAAMVNMTQPVMMTGPYLSQHGVGAASKALAKAIPYAMGKKEIADAELKAALKRASQEGIVDAQEIFHIYSVGAQGVASGLVNSLARLPGVGGTIKAGSEDARTRVNAFLTLWGSMFSLAEGFNRKLTFLAAWDVAKSNKEANPYAFAVRAVNETQGIYNKANRPNWARSAAGRVILTFKQFSLMYIELLSRMWKRGGPEGKRAALIMLAMLMLAAGEEGLPFAQDLDDLIDTIGQMFGLDTNMRRNKRRLAHELLGKNLGDLFLYGLSAHLPIDLSGRLGLGNLIPGTGILKPSDEQMRGRNVAEIFGPTAGMATQIGDAYDATTEGNTGKALQNLAPKAIKDLMAAVEMTKKRYATDAKGRKVVDIGLSDVVAKGIGFNPTKVAQTHRKTMPIQQDISLQKRTESAIVDQWARGVADSDKTMVEEAMKRRDKWNETNPSAPIAIRSTQIRDRVRQMAMEKEGRLLKQAPREMRGAIGLDLAD